MDNEQRHNNVADNQESLDTKPGAYRHVEPLPHKSEGHGSLVKLIQTLQRVDVAAPLAETNAYSIDDNNGGRIIL